MRLIIASNNAHKVGEIKSILSQNFTDILSLKEAGIEVDVVEDGETFEANALKKAAEVLTLAPEGYCVLSDDSGLMVDALGGAPGVHSARFAGEGHDDAANNIKLLEKLKAVPEEARGAKFVTTVVLLQEGRPPVVANGSVEGKILYTPTGKNGFGYDPLFFYPPFGRTFAELTAEEKNRVSHRKRALEELKRLLDTK